MCDEDAFLREKEKEIRLCDSSLVHQVLLHQWVCSQFNTQHMECFRKLACIPGFLGSIQLGISLEFTAEGPMELGAGVDGDMEVDDNNTEAGGGHHFNEWNTDEEDDSDGDEDELATQLYHVLQITSD